MKSCLLLAALFVSLTTCKTDESRSPVLGAEEPAGGNPSETSIIQAFLGKLDKNPESDFRIWENPSEAGQVLAAVKTSKNGEYINLYPFGQKRMDGSWIMISDDKGNYKDAKLIVIAGYNESQGMESAWASTLELRQYTGSFKAILTDNQADKADYSFTFDIFGDVGALFSSKPTGTIDNTAFAPDENLWMGFGSPRCSCPESFDYSHDGGELSIYMHENKPFAMFYFAGAGFARGGKKILDSYTDKPANLSNQEPPAIEIKDLTFKSSK